MFSCLFEMNQLSEDELSGIKAESAEDAKKILVEFGIPEDLILNMDMLGYLSLKNDDDIPVAVKESDGWIFEGFEPGYLAGIRDEVKKAKKSGKIKTYCDDVRTQFRKKINDGIDSGPYILPDINAPDITIKPEEISVDRTLFRKRRLIINDLDFNPNSPAIIPTPRHEGGIEKAYDKVSGNDGGLIGIIGGFDFLASITANGNFPKVIGFDINPYQVLFGAIRIALCDISPTPYHHLRNLLSLEIEDHELCESFEDLEEFFIEAEFERPSQTVMQKTWTEIEPILTVNKDIPVKEFRKVWEDIFKFYSGQNALKKSVITGEQINIYLRELEEVSLRKSENGAGSWLATQSNYDKVRYLSLSKNLLLMSGDLFEEGIENANKILEQEDTKLSVIYISNVPTYGNQGHPKRSQLEANLRCYKDSGVFVTDGSDKRGMTFNIYQGLSLK